MVMARWMTCDSCAICGGMLQEKDLRNREKGIGFCSNCHGLHILIDGMTFDFHVDMVEQAMSIYDIILIRRSLFERCGIN